jgi:hypothetical protein
MFTIPGCTQPGYPARNEEMPAAPTRRQLLRLARALAGKERHHEFGQDLLADAPTQGHPATVDPHDNEAAIILYNFHFPTQVEAHGQQPGPKHPAAPMPGNPYPPAGRDFGQGVFQGSDYLRQDVLVLF